MSLLVLWWVLIRVLKMGRWVIWLMLLLVMVGLKVLGLLVV